MGRRMAGQRDGKKVGVVEGWEQCGCGRGMGRRRMGQRDGKKGRRLVDLYLLVLYHRTCRAQAEIWILYDHMK